MKKATTQAVTSLGPVKNKRNGASRGTNGPRKRKKGVLASDDLKGNPKEVSDPSTKQGGLGGAE